MWVYGLWYFKVIKGAFSVMESILSARSRLDAIFFSSEVIVEVVLFEGFFCVCGGCGCVCVCVLFLILFLFVCLFVCFLFFYMFWLCFLFPKR